MTAPEAITRAAHAKAATGEQKVQTISTAVLEPKQLWHFVKRTDPMTRGRLLIKDANILRRK